MENLIKVVCHRAAMYQNIIKEYYNEFPKMYSEYLIHDTLKIKWGVGKTLHDQKFIMIIMGSKSNLIHIFRSHPNLMVSWLQVSLREYSSSY